MRDWLLGIVPGPTRPFVAWLLEPNVLLVVSLASVLLLVVSVLAIPRSVARIPATYFLPRSRRPPAASRTTAFHVGKNALGVLLLGAGLAMLVLPGQGLLTIIVALMLIDFPGKRRLLRRLVARPRVRKTLDHIRERAGEPPLELD